MNNTTDIIENIDLSIFDDEDLAELNSRLLKGKFDLSKYFEGEKLAFVERIKPFSSGLQVANLKLSELASIKARIWQHYEMFGHYEIGELLKFTNKLILEQKELKKELWENIEQIKKLEVI